MQVGGEGQSVGLESSNLRIYANQTSPRLIAAIYAPIGTWLTFRNTKLPVFAYSSR